MSHVFYSVCINGVVLRKIYVGVVPKSMVKPPDKTFVATLQRCRINICMHCRLQRQNLFYPIVFVLCGGKLNLPHSQQYSSKQVQWYWDILCLSRGVITTLRLL